MCKFVSTATQFNEMRCLDYYIIFLLLPLVTALLCFLFFFLSFAFVFLSVDAEIMIPFPENHKLSTIPSVIAMPGAGQKVVFPCFHYCQEFRVIDICFVSFWDLFFQLHSPPHTHTPHHPPTHTHTHVLFQLNGTCDAHSDYGIYS